MLPIAILIVLFAITLHLSPKSKEARTKILFFYYILMAIVLGVRGISVGDDTIAYFHTYKEIARYSLKYSIENIRFEWGYLIFAKTFSSLGFSYLGFQISCSFLIMLLLANFIRNTTDDYLTATIIFCGAGFMAFTINGLRQAIAIAIACNGWLLWRNKKYFWAIIVVALAISFHKLAYAYILAYLLYSFRKSKFVCIGLPIVLAILALSGSLLSYLNAMSTEMDLYSHYFTMHNKLMKGGYIKILWVLFISIIIYILSSKKFNYNAKYIAVLGSWWMCFTYLEESLRHIERVGTNFFPFVMIVYCIFGDKLPLVYKRLYFLGINAFYLFFYIYRQSAETYDYETFF